MSAHGYDSRGYAVDGHGLPVGLLDGPELLPSIERSVLAGRAVLAAGLGAMERLVFAALAGHAVGDFRTPYALLGQRDVAVAVGVSVRTVGRTLVALEQAGTIGPTEHVPHVAMGPRGLRPLWALWPDLEVPR